MKRFRHRLLLRRLSKAKPRQKYLQHLAMAGLLMLSNATAIILNVRPAQSRATNPQVTITYPGPNDYISQDYAFITGTSGASKNIALFADNQYIGSTQANEAGVWGYRWKDAPQGQHSFRATAIDGRMTINSAIGENSVRSYQVNTGESIMQSPTGISQPVQTIVDSSLNKIFVINQYSKTVSVISTDTYQRTGDINYAFAAGSQASNVGYITTLMDVSSHRLYLLAETYVNVIDTDAETVIKSIDLPGNNSFTSIFNTPDWSRLILVNDEREIVNIDTTSFETDLVAISEYIRNDEESIALYNPVNDSLYVATDVDWTSVSIINSQTGDTTGQVNVQTDDNLAEKVIDGAFSEDFSELYLLYNSPEGPPVCTIDDCVQADPEMRIASFADDGNTRTFQATTTGVPIYSRFVHKTTVDGYLYVTQQPYNPEEARPDGWHVTDGSPLQTFNTSSHVFASLPNQVGTARLLNEPLTLLTSQGGFSTFAPVDLNNHRMYYVSMSTNADQLIYNTVDTTAGEVIDSVTKELVDPPPVGGYISDQLQEPSYGLTRALSFNPSAGKLMYLPWYSMSNLETFDINDSEVETVDNLVGPALLSVAVPTSGDTFTAVTAPSSPLPKAIITRVDGTTGNVEARIHLPEGQDLLSKMALSDDGTKLFAVVWTTTGIIVHRIDVGSNVVDRTYTAMASIGEPLLNNFEADVAGNYLYATTQPGGGASMGLTKLNLTSDTITTVTVGTVGSSNSSTIGITGLLNVSESGSHVAVNLNGSIKVYRTSDMALIRTIATSFPYKLPMQLSNDGASIYMATYPTSPQTGPIGYTVKKYSTSTGALQSTIGLAPNLKLPFGSYFFGLIGDMVMSDDGNTLFVGTSTLSFGPTQSTPVFDQNVTSVDTRSNAAVMSTKFGVSYSTSNLEGTFGYWIGELSVTDDTVEAETNFTVVGGGVTITKPSDGETVYTSPTIEGVAPVSSSVAVKLDGNILGTVTSDTHGKWTIPAGSIAKGSHTVHAEYYQEPRRLMYLGNSNLMQVLGAGFDDFGSWANYLQSGTGDLVAATNPIINNLPQIDVLDTEKGVMVDQVALPQNALGTANVISPDGKYLLTVGFANGQELFDSPNPDFTPGMWLTETRTNKVVKTLNLIGAIYNNPELSEALSMGLITNTIRLSSDNSKLYITTPEEVFTLNTDNFFVGTRAFIDSTTHSTLGNGEVPILNSTFNQKLINNGSRLITVSANGQGLRVIDLADHSVQSIPDQDGHITQLIYNEQRNEVYAIGYLESSGAVGGMPYEVYKVDLDTLQITSEVTIDDELQFPFGASLSSDGENLYIAQFGISNTEQRIYHNVVSISLEGFTASTGADTNLETYEQFLNLFATNFVNPAAIWPAGRGFEVGSNAAGSRQFIPNITSGLNQGEFGAGKAFLTQPGQNLIGSGTLYSSSSDEFTGVTPGNLYTDDSTFTLADQPVTPPPTPTPGTPPPTPTPGTPPTIPDTFTPLPTTPYQGSGGGGGSTRSPSVQQKTATKPNVFLAFLKRIGYVLTHLPQFVPKGVVTILPYILLLLILAVILTYLYQTRKELEHDKRLQRLLAYHTMLATEKSNFLQLVSHYLRTPLTVLSGGIEMGKTVTDITTQKSLEADVAVLNKTVEALITNIENDTTMQEMETEPILKVSRKEVYKNKYFYYPAIVLATILGLFYLLFVVIGNASINLVNLGVQILATGLSLQLLYNISRNKMVVQRESERIDALDSFEKKLDSMRAEFVHEAQYTLVFTINKLSETIKRIPNEQYRSYAQKGIGQLQELIASFHLVSQLASNKLEGTIQPTSVKNTVEQAVRGLDNAAKERNVTVAIEGLETDYMLQIEPSLLSLTVKALLSNAIDASAQGAQITLKCMTKDDKVAIQVIDHGKGLTAEQMNTVFKPFTRVEDVEDFDKTGVGLGLYTSRMFAHAFNGELNLESVKDKGTIASLSLPMSATTK